MRPEPRNAMERLALVAGELIEDCGKSACRKVQEYADQDDKTCDEIAKFEFACVVESFIARASRQDLEDVVRFFAPKGMEDILGIVRQNARRRAER